MNKITINDLTPLDERFFGNTGEIVFFNICEFADKVFGENHYSNPEYSYNALQKAILDFHPDVNYYSAPREDFDLAIAAFETKQAGKHYCIVEDLS